MKPLFAWALFPTDWSNIKPKSLQKEVIGYKLRINSCTVPFQKVQSSSSLSPLQSALKQDDINKGSLPSNIVGSIPRIASNKFDSYRDYYHVMSNNDSRVEYKYETPVLIEGAMDPSQCDQLCDSLFEIAGDTCVDLQRKRRGSNHTRNNNGEREIRGRKRNRKNAKKPEIAKVEEAVLHVYPDISLKDVSEYIMDSNHDDAIFCFCEGLLKETSGIDPQTSQNEFKLKELQHLLDETRERYFGKNDRDHFPYFPSNVRPSDCIIMAGEGATSTLHRDPYEWTGTNLCLEGTKIWRFIIPPSIQHYHHKANPYAFMHDTKCGVSFIDEALQSNPIPSIAWQTSNYDSNDTNSMQHDVYMSQGWQTHLSLFHTRDDTIPSARTFASMDHDPPNCHGNINNNDDSKFHLMQSIASDLDKLQPNIPLSYDHCSTSLNHLMEDISSIESSPIQIHTLVQKAGDLLLIPPYWYHQTYALEPSIAVASQRCGQENDIRRVLHHILQSSFKNKSDQSAVNEIMLAMETQLCERERERNDPEFLVDTFFDMLQSHLT
mmetsp:Transcript_7051/g.10102  ORF Transcript_7051/g.10102 Transcript_7051/m.10102 type:complete len:549 (-) Transcript_7051:52-1698(-)